MKKRPSKYLSFSLWFDFFRRRTFFYVRRILHIGQDVIIHRDADVSPLASIRPLMGSVKIGRSTIVHRGAIIRGYGGRIEIGELCTIGPYSTVYAGGNLIIGSFVRIGPHVKIIAGNHEFRDRDAKIIEQGMNLKGIIIEDDVWIGAGACVLDGVELQKGTVVGANAVVTKSTQEYEIVVGVPAKVVSVRKAS